jgi:multidrug efflux pump subunit AcrA (membrane-fusion protein)
VSHPVDVLKAALQEAKTEAATLRIKTATLAQERNAVIEERNKARARVKELEQQNAVQRENVDEAMRQHERALAAWYGLSVPCDKCGSPAWKPCITDTGRFTVHSPRVTKAVAAIPADDSLTPEGPPRSPEARIRELEAEVQRLQQDRAQVGAFGFKPLGIR